MKKFILLIILSLATISCEDLSIDLGNKPLKPNESIDYIFYDNVVVIDKSHTCQIEVIDKTTIQIDNSIDIAHFPQEDDIIYCMTSDEVPYGFIGRVISSEDNDNCTIFTTEEPLLIDIFKELHIDTRVELPKDIPYFLDSDGNKYKCSNVGNGIWDSIDGSNVGKTRASASFGGSHTIKIGISNSGIFSGDLYINSGVRLQIDITGGVLKKFEYEFSKRCGIVGGIELSTEKSRKIPLVNKTMMLPFSITVGPIILTTDFNVECGLECHAETCAKGNISFEFDSSTCKFSYNNGTPKYETIHNDISANKHLLLTRFETESQIGAGLYFNSAMEMACYHRNILAVGAGVKGIYGISVSNPISFDNKDLLILNPVVTVAPTISAGAFCRSKLFKWSGNEEEFGLYREFEFAKFELPIFPEFYDFVAKSANNKIAITSQLIKNNFIKTSEEGFALFKKDTDTAIEHKTISSTTRSNDISITFDVDNADDYIVKPYTVADGIYFYGEEYDDKWVDLGLSVLWAKYNVGANSPEEYGGYYAWGETEEKESYTFENYMYAKDIIQGENGIYHIYQDIGEDISGTIYDVASIKWGDGARMPNYHNITELCNYCDYELGEVNGIAGYYIIGPNKNRIFLPYTGLRCDDNLEDAGLVGVFRSSTKYTSEYGVSSYGLEVELDEYELGVGGEFTLELGIPVRPIKDK